MNKFKVSDIRWANNGDLTLPFWKIWNKNNPLPDGFWQRIWEYPYVSSRIPKNSTSLDVGGTYPFVLFPNFPNAVSVDIRDLNRIDHPLHKGLWPKEKQIICDATSIPIPDNHFDYAFSVSALEEMPDTISAIKELIRLAKHRVVFTMDISEKLGYPTHELRELEYMLNIRLPQIPIDVLYSTSPILNQFKQSSLSEYEDIRVLAMTIDSIDEPKSVGIIVPHWESWMFLKPCLEIIKDHKRNDQIEHIYVIDDDSKDGSYEKAMKYFENDEMIEFHQVIRENKNVADVGYLLDYGINLVKEQYIAMIDADVFPLSDEWISFPIWLIEKYGCSSVGLDTGLSQAYYKERVEIPWSFPKSGYPVNGGLYDNQAFTITNNLYRVIPTAIAKVVSESIGFTRGKTPKSKPINFYQRIINKALRVSSKLFGINLSFPSQNTRYPYLPDNCDNGVAANHFIDINKFGPKFNIPLTSYIGLTEKDGAFGQNICNLIFHFALSTRALSRERREVNDAGKLFDSWVNRLISSDFIDSKTIDDMVEASKIFQPGAYDGSIPISWYRQEYDYIELLKNEYRRSRL